MSIPASSSVRYSSGWPSWQHGGFSLIELLVVICIIVVLAAMLVPAIGLVRNQAKTVQCASAQRQLGMAMLTYASDWHGALPRIKEPKNGTDWTQPMHWWNTAAEYVEFEQNQLDNVSVAAHKSVIWGCPLWPQTTTNVWTGCVGYGMNFWPHSPQKADCSDYWDWGPAANDIYMSSISEVSRRVLFGEASNWMLNPYPVTAWPPFSVAPSYQVVFDPARHMGGAVYTFFDGHVQRIDKSLNTYYGIADPTRWSP